MQNRSQRIEQRSKRNKETEQGLTVAGLEGNTHWEKTVNLVNFNFTRCHPLPHRFPDLSSC